MWCSVASYKMKDNFAHFFFACSAQDAVTNLPNILAIAMLLRYDETAVVEFLCFECNRNGRVPLVLDPLPLLLLVTHCWYCLFQFQITDKNDM